MKENRNIKKQDFNLYLNYSFKKKLKVINLKKNFLKSFIDKIYLVQCFC